MDARGIGISNLPTQKQQASFRKKIDYNIMVVGANGLGKTTFLNMLLDTDKIPLDVFSTKDGDTVAPFAFEHGHAAHASDPVVDAWYKNAPVNFQKYVVSVLERGLSVNLSLVEADNVGNSICNVDCAEHVEAYIKRQLALYQDSECHMARAHVSDTRVHACLFFIAPSLAGPTHLDLCVMKRISRLCNLIPVVAKSDTLAQSEAAECYEKIRASMRNHRIPFFCEEIEEGWRAPPYFLISFTKNKHGEYVRMYPWGKLRLENEAAGDFYRLRDLLIRKGFCRLLESTKQLYINFKTTQLMAKYHLATDIVTDLAIDLATDPATEVVTEQHAEVCVEQQREIE